MAIAQIPQKVALAAQETARDWTDRARGLPRNDKAWARSIAIGSLVAGVVLLARGKRKAAIAATAAGAAVALLENPEEVSAIWQNLPAYLQQGKQFLARLEEYVEDLSGQGGQWKSLIDKIGRR